MINSGKKTKTPTTNNIIGGTMKRTLALLALAGLALTGCSALTEVPAPAATTAAATTTAPPAVSVADYIAGTTSTRRELQSWLEKAEELPCGFGSLVMEQEFQDVLCASRAVSTQSQANVIVLELEGMVTPDSGFYVGAPPMVIETSLGRSIEQAKAIQAETQTIKDEDCSPTLGCAGHFRTIETGMQAIADELDSWAAYK